MAEGQGKLIGMACTRAAIPAVILTAAYCVTLAAGIIDGSPVLVAAAVAAIHVSGAHLFGIHGQAMERGRIVAAAVWHVGFATVGVGLGFQIVIIIARHLFLRPVLPPGPLALAGGIAALIGVGAARIAEVLLAANPQGKKKATQSSPESYVPDFPAMRMTGVEDAKALLACLGAGGAVLLEGDWILIDPVTAAGILGLLLYSSVANAYTTFDSLRTMGDDAHT